MDLDRILAAPRRWKANVHLSRVCVFEKGTELLSWPSTFSLWAGRSSVSLRSIKNNMATLSRLLSPPAGGVGRRAPMSLCFSQSSGTVHAFVEDPHLGVNSLPWKQACQDDRRVPTQRLKPDGQVRHNDVLKGHSGSRTYFINSFVNCNGSYVVYNRTCSDKYPVVKHFRPTGHGGLLSLKSMATEVNPDSRRGGDFLNFTLFQLSGWSFFLHFVFIFWLLSICLALFVFSLFFTVRGYNGTSCSCSIYTPCCDHFWLVTLKKACMCRHMLVLIFLLLQCISQTNKGFKKKKFLKRAFVLMEARHSHWHKYVTCVLRW